MAGYDIQGEPRGGDQVHGSAQGFLCVFCSPRCPFFLLLLEVRTDPSPPCAIIVWISQNITYGLYLSDHSILDGIDTEIVVLSGIMMQNLVRETGWHLRGTRRVGVSKEDTETIQQCVSSIYLPLFGG